MADTSNVKSEPKLRSVKIIDAFQEREYFPDKHYDLEVNIKHEAQTGYFLIDVEGKPKRWFSGELGRRRLGGDTTLKLGLFIPKDDDDAVAGELPETRIRVVQIDNSLNEKDDILRGKIRLESLHYEVKVEVNDNKVGIAVNNVLDNRNLQVKSLELSKNEENEAEWELSGFHGPVEVLPNTSKKIDCSLKPLKPTTEEKEFNFTLKITAVFIHNGKEESAHPKGTLSGFIKWKPVPARAWRSELVSPDAPKVANGCQPSVLEWAENDSLLSLYLIYRGIDDRVCELYKMVSDGSGKWKRGDRFEGSDVEEACGYTWKTDSPKGSQHLVILAGGVIEEWWRPSTHDLWKWEKGWKTGGGDPTRPQGRPAGYAWEGDDSQHIIFRGDDNFIWEAWYPKDKKENKETWAVERPPLKNNNCPPAAGDPSAYAWEDDPKTLRHKKGSQHILYRSNDSHIIELWGRLINDGNPEWDFKDVSKEAGAPPTNGDPIGFAHKNGMLILNRTQDGHILQFSYEPQSLSWKHEDLTIKAGLKAARFISGVFLTHSDKLNVIFQSDDDGLYELWFDSAVNAWKHGVILTDEHIAPAASASIATFSHQSEGRRLAYIFYRGKDDLLHILSRQEEQ